MADTAGPNPSRRALSRQTVTAAIACVAAAMLVGVALGFLLFRGDSASAPPPAADLQTGDADRRTQELTGQRPDRQPVTTSEDIPPTPTPDPALQELERRLEEERARLEERARQASDSPLTPAARDMAELVAGRISGDDGTAPEAQEPPEAQTPSVPARPAPARDATDGTDGPPSFLLARGSVIPTVLESRIDSELPGLVRARVAETVFDTVTGRHVLIPRGSWLVGTYGSDGLAGQRRMSVTWTDLRLPDGGAVPLDGFGTLGDDGAGGVRGRRSTGLLPALGAAVLFDLAGNATRIVTGDGQRQQGDLAALLGEATGGSVTRVGERHAGELLARGTRFRVPPGTRMNVLVNQDIELAEWSADGGR